MGKVKLFWKSECPHCGNAKIVSGQLEEEGLHVYDYNLDTPDGLAEASYYSVMSTPSIVISEGNNVEVKSWRSAVPTEEEILAHVR